MLHQFRRFLRLPVDFPQGLDEGVQRVPVFRLRRLNHQGLVNNQRKIHRGRVEAVVQQPLGYLQAADAPFPLPVGGEHHLVHTGAVVGEIVDVAEGLQQVVGVQDGVAADGLDTSIAQGADVGVGPHQYAKVAVKAANLADAMFRSIQNVKGRLVPT